MALARCYQGIHLLETEEKWVRGMASSLKTFQSSNIRSPFFYRDLQVFSFLFFWLIQNICDKLALWIQLPLLHQDELLVAQLFISSCLQAVGLFELNGRCGESIAVLDEGFKHLNQATHLAKVSTGKLFLVYERCSLK